MLGVFSVVALGFAIPLSTSLTSIFTILASLSWLVCGGIKTAPKLFFNNPVIRAALLLFALFFVGIIYSSAELNEAFHGVNTYRKLFLIIVFSFFMRKECYQRWAIYSFFGGCLILLVTSCVSYWNIIPSFSLHDNTITSRVTQSILMAFFAFWLAINFIAKVRLKALYGLLLAIAAYNIFFVVTGRSGYIIFLSLITFFFYHYFNKKKLMIGILVISVLLLSSLFFNNKFSNRIILTKNNIQAYWKHNNNNTSVGQRFDFAKTSSILFIKKPLLGYGTGSFRQEYKKMSEQIGTYITDNPHNEYLSISVQLGLIGLIMFIYLLYIQWKYSKRLTYERVLAQGFVLTMAIGSLMNSMLLDSGEGHFFAYFSAVLFANVTSNKSYHLE